ncbi:MAG: carboxypeptidase regulatory-like domain-containing protein [Gemmatimonadota bacterium]
MEACRDRFLRVKLGSWIALLSLALWLPLHTASAQGAGSIEGRVVDASAAGVADVAVALAGTDRTSLTDADGRFAFDDVTRGPASCW